MSIDLSQGHRSKNGNSLCVYSANLKQSQSKSQENYLTNKSLNSQNMYPTVFKKSDIKEFEPGNEDKSYLQVLYRSMRYVRKQEERDFIDDGIMAEQFSQHISISTNPTYLTTTGAMLLRNGYVIIAYCILIGRLHHSQLCFQYMLTLFDATFDIKTHCQQFQYYKHRDPISFAIPNRPIKSQRQNPKEQLKRQVVPSQLNKSAIIN